MTGKFVINHPVDMSEVFSLLERFTDVDWKFIDELDQIEGIHELNVEIPFDFTPESNGRSIHPDEPAIVEVTVEAKELTEDCFNQFKDKINKLTLAHHPEYIIALKYNMDNYFQEIIDSDYFYEKAVEHYDEYLEDWNAQRADYLYERMRERQWEESNN